MAVTVNQYSRKIRLQKPSLKQHSQKPSTVQTEENQPQFQLLWLSLSIRPELKYVFKPALNFINYIEFERFCILKKHPVLMEQL